MPAGNANSPASDPVPPRNIKNRPSDPKIEIWSRWASEIQTWPTLSTATYDGDHSSAEVAGPPSPEYAVAPVPATVVMMPEVDTRRIRWFPVSAM